MNKSAQSISLNHITKKYKLQSNDYIALKDASLTFSSNEFIAIVGKSGSGKSTLLNMISCIDRPTSGEIYYGDLLINKLSETELAKWRGTNIGIVFQFFQLIPTLTVLENILLPMDFCHTYSTKDSIKIAYELMKKTGIEKYANNLPINLSGGEQQRVAIARALANDPSFIIADEPTGNLDSKTANKIIDLFKTLTNEGKTVIMVTHSNELADCADRIITINDGNVISDTKGGKN